MVSHVSSVSGVILVTVVSNLARLFLTGAAGDIDLARQAAAAMLSAYNPQTQPELILAAETIAFSLQSLEALGQSTAEDMSLNKVMRLRGSAVSLNREAHRSHQKLEQMQRSRWTSEAEQAAHAERTAEAPAAGAPAADLSTADMLMGADVATGPVGAAAGEARADMDRAAPVAAGLSPTGATVNDAALDREAALAASDTMASAAAMPFPPAAQPVAAEQAATATPPASAPVPMNPPAGQAHPAGPKPTDYRGQDCSQPHRKRFLAQQIVENGKRAALQAAGTGTGQAAHVAMR